MVATILVTLIVTSWWFDNMAEKAQIEYQRDSGKKKTHGRMKGQMTQRYLLTWDKPQSLFE